MEDQQNQLYEQIRDEQDSNEGKEMPMSDRAVAMLPPPAMAGGYFSADPS